MLEFIKQSKKRKLYCILGILYLLCIIFVANDAWLYSTPIAKLTKVETSVSGEETGTRGTKEKKYKQNIQGVILNGENKGKTISFTNEYTYTGMMKQPYHKGAYDTHRISDVYINYRCRKTGCAYDIDRYF